MGPRLVDCIVGVEEMADYSDETTVNCMAAMKGNGIEQEAR
jgi:hypothetical protein